MTEIVSSETYTVDGVGKVRFMLLDNGDIDLSVDREDGAAWAMRGMHHLPFYLIKDMCKKFGEQE